MLALQPITLLSSFHHIIPLAIRFAPDKKSFIIDRWTAMQKNLANFYFRSSLFFILSSIGAVLNYGLYIFLAHILNVRDFGDFAVIMALSNQILGILLAINLTSIYLVKSEGSERAKIDLQTIQKLLIWFFIAFIILLGFIWPSLVHWLKIQDSIALLILALMLLCSIPSIIWTGFLQGHKKLFEVGLFNFSSSAFKFIFALALGYIGGLVGSLSGVLIGLLLGLLTVRITAHIELPSVRTIFSKLTANEKVVVSGLRSYIIASTLVVGFLSLLQNIDITYAKVLFDPNTAGVYSGISILSNSIYYIALMLIWIVLPEISIENNAHNQRLLKTSYRLLAVLGLVIVLIELIFKNILASLLLGSKFSGQGDLLVYASMYQILLVGVTLYAFYLLVLRDVRALILCGCIIIPSATLPWIFGNTTLEMIRNLFYSILLGTIIYSLINVTYIKNGVGHARKTS
jgi:O-antigen/teichoic acid export membrane protein